MGLRIADPLDPRPGASRPRPHRLAQLDLAVSPNVDGIQSQDRHGDDWEYHLCNVRFLRIVLSVVLFFLVLSLVMAIGGPETGPIEKVVVGCGLAGLLALAPLVRRIGRSDTPA